METRSLCGSLPGFDSQAPKGIRIVSSVFWRLGILKMKPPGKLYQFHVANLQEIDRAMKRVARSLREAISKGDEITVSSFMRLYALLVGAWAECRLRKLIYEPNGFDSSEREIIQTKGTQLKQWQTAIEIAFRKQYKIPKAPLTANNLA